MLQNSILLLVLVAGALVAPMSGFAQEPVPDLDTLLARMGRVARLYADEALRFTCDEKIVDSQYEIDRVTRRREYELAYVYVFEEPSAVAGTDLRAGLRDYRAELALVGNPEGVTEVDLDDLELTAFLRRAYSWVFIFGDGLAPYFEFSIQGRERTLDRDAIVVAFKAQPPYRVGMNDWIGTAWIDLETYQLLRVEAMTPADVEEKARAENARKGRDVTRPQYVYASVTTVFGAEKNGMRFPSQVTMSGTWVGWVRGVMGRPGDFRERTIYRVEQRYDNYSFFSARVESEVRAFVLFGTEIKRDD